MPIASSGNSTKGPAQSAKSDPKLSKMGRHRHTSPHMLSVVTVHFSANNRRAKHLYQQSFRQDLCQHKQHHCFLAGLGSTRCSFSDWNLLTSRKFLSTRMQAPYHIRCKHKHVREATAHKPVCVNKLWCVDPYFTTTLMTKMNDFSMCNGM